MSSLLEESHWRAPSLHEVPDPGVEVGGDGLVLVLELVIRVVVVEVVGGLTGYEGWTDAEGSVGADAMLDEVLVRVTNEDWAVGAADEVVIEDIEVRVKVLELKLELEAGSDAVVEVDVLDLVEVLAGGTLLVAGEVGLKNTIGPAWPFEAGHPAKASDLVGGVVA